MIYSRFGTRLTLLSKEKQDDGRLFVRGIAEGAADGRDYLVGDLKADEGTAEIEEAVAKLPWKTEQQTAKREQ